MSGRDPLSRAGPSFPIARESSDTCVATLSQSLTLTFFVAKSDHHVNDCISIIVVDGDIIRQHRSPEQGDDVSNKQHDKVNQSEDSTHLAS